MHFLVLIWGFTAILGLLITIPPVEVVFYRTLFATLGLGILIYFYKIPLNVGKKPMLQILLTGALISSHWILFFLSARVSTASVCLAGLATTSFWTSILEPILLKKRIRWNEVFLGIFVVVGIYIIFRVEFVHTLGIIFALSSALLAALFTVINARFANAHHHHTITFYEMTGACISICLFFPVYKMLFAENQQLSLHLSYSDLVYILILAMVCTVYAYSASIEIMKKISPFSINLTINMEPVYGIILAVLIFGDDEKMQTGFYIGAAIILLSVLAHPVLNKLFHRKYLETDNLR